MKTKILLASVLTVVAVAVLWAQNKGNKSPELPDEVKEWERLAEQGDTVALHKLLSFYDNNAPAYFEVEEVIEVEDESGEWIAATDSIECDTMIACVDSLTEMLYNSRLDYWLSKGLAMNDPTATYIKGMRLYYTDEVKHFNISQSPQKVAMHKPLFSVARHISTKDNLTTL